MAPFRLFSKSIKWRITAAFILLSTGFMSLYVLVTKHVFESDKISYVFESKQVQNEQYAESLSAQIARVTFDARAILSGLDSDQHKVNPSSQQLFSAQPSLLAITVDNLINRENLLTLEKQSGTLVRWNQQLGAVSAAAAGETKLTKLDGRNFAADIAQNSENQPYRIRIIFEMQSPFKAAGDGEYLAVINDGHVVFDASSGIVNQGAVDRFLSTEKKQSIGETSLRVIDQRNFLVSSSRVNGSSLSVLSLLDEVTALRALRVLYLRSLVFLAFAFFSTILLALLASNSITRNISALKRVAERIGQGDFDAHPDFEAQDEMGTLATAFTTMGQEIKKLLKDTAEKARMESELQTAKLVQNSLFPKSPIHQSGRLRVAGLNASSSECSGDWWFHFEKGSLLYVMIADATGHGTPAALITSAARSLFSIVERYEVSLQEIATLWNRAIQDCSGGEVCMTGLIMRIDNQTGVVEVINASHEWPILLHSDGAQLPSYEADSIALPPNPRLGDHDEEVWVEHRIELAPGDMLFLYTDGIFDVKNESGRPYRERMLMKGTAEIAARTGTAEGLTEGIYKAISEYGDGSVLVDDITLVTVQYMTHAFADYYLRSLPATAPEDFNSAS